jgi:hypothetical protein
MDFGVDVFESSNEENTFAERDAKSGVLVEALRQWREK